ncbi:MAG: pirin family protein [Planctomycetota bacterium]
MNTQRRQFIALTATGLIHIAKRPAELLAGEENDMRMLVREGAQRGHTDLGWLDSYHTFSFGRFYDQRHMGFRSLRVINDDRVAAGRGFPTHPHRDMEILSYVLDGALQHRDSTGRGAIVRPGDVQLMSAGTGITHSEYNPSKVTDNHFLQIWIQPSLTGIRPRYQQKRVADAQKANRWCPIATPNGDEGTVAIQQDARIFSTIAEPGQRLDYVVQRNRHAWLHVANGELVVNGTRLRAGDAVATSMPTDLHVKANVKSEALLFDLG